MDDFNTKISIIFPSYNGEKFLKRNLESIKNLTNLYEIELIIIDNNSNDSSIEIIHDYKKDINIKLFRKYNNLGFAKACNIGVLNAKGEFIFITNQDMIFPPNCFQKLKIIYYNYIQNQKIVISPAFVFEGDGIHYFGAKIHFLGFSYTPEIGQKLPQKKIVKNTQRIAGGGFFMEKELFLELGGFDNLFFMYYEDTDLSLRILRQGLKIYTTNKTYIIHQKNKSTFSDFQYFLLERNRFIVFFKNINNFKKLIPLFILIEIFLLFQSIIIKKFKLRIRIYYELLSNRKFIKKLRIKSKQKANLLPYQKLSKTLDSNLLGDLKHFKVFNKFLNLFNYLLKLI